MARDRRQASSGPTTLVFSACFLGEPLADTNQTFGLEWLCQAPLLGPTFEEVSVPRPLPLEVSKPSGDAGDHRPETGANDSFESVGERQLPPVPIRPLRHKPAGGWGAFHSQELLDL